MVFCTLSETYDLSTKPNKMSLIGIHTPSKEIIQKTYPGLCMNAKYVRIVKQDVTMACASMLPADPLQIGVEAGDIAPQDMFNPILYKAVSNESMSTLEARLAGLSENSQYNVINGQSVIKSDKVTGLTDDFNVYYSLLSNRDGFKTANPQSGLTMKDLVPFVFDRYYNYGENNTLVTTGNDTVKVIQNNSSGEIGSAPVHKQVASMRGRPHPMPRFNTTYLTAVPASTSGYQDNGMGDGSPVNANAEMPDIMPVYTACIVMPPCKLNRLYYRLVVRTTLEFTEVRPIQEITTFSQMNSVYGPLVYVTDYASQSKSMTALMGMVDTQEAEIEKIMEGA